MIADIAEEARVPRKFLEQILVDLKKRGIVRSVRYVPAATSSAREPKDHQLRRRHPYHRRPTRPQPCVSATAYHRCEDCDDEKTCAIRKVLLAARDATAPDAGESRTLAMAVTGQRGGDNSTPPLPLFCGAGAGGGLPRGRPAPTRLPHRQKISHSPSSGHVREGLALPGSPTSLAPRPQGAGG